MANPSLQIGNDNWAIKEDNLLGYSTAGTRFVPQPITMTRATLGTRVNPSGLVEDVALLGSELVVNGDFATDSDWTKGAGWTISVGKANSLNSSSSFYQASSFISGKSYKVTFDITNLSSGQVSYRTNATQNYFSENGTHTINWLYDGSFNFIYFLADNFTGSIDNVSVKEATIDNLPRVDYTDGTSSLLVEPQRTNLIPYSEDFSLWIQYGSPTIVQNIISPDGTLNGTQLTRGSSQTPLRYSNVTTLNQEYTFSIYAKKGSVDVMFLDIGDETNASFTLTDEWQRFTVTSTPTTYTHIDLSLGTSVSGDYIYIYGAQTELGSYPTSYIKTSGSTVTRNQETYTKTGISDLINSEEGVLFGEIAALSDDGTNRSITLSDGSTNNIIQILFSSVSNTIRFIIRVGGVGGDNLDKSTSTYTVTDFNKVALKWKQNDAQVWINGTQLGSPDTNSDVPTGLNDLSFEYLTVGNNFFGKVKQLQVFKTALSDSELATLTS